MTDDERTPAMPARKSDSQTGPPVGYREIGFRHSREFVPILRGLRCSLLVSTYAAGKLAVIGADESGLTLRFHNFEQAMGVAVSPSTIAVGTRQQIWFLRNAFELASQLPPSGTYDACYLTRESHVTGRIHAHELAWSGSELWVVNTRFSCLCTLHEDYSYVPRWRPPFISALEGNDRCHLNGLAMEDGRPRYVTAMSETNEPAGWRSTKAESGCVIDVPSGRTVTRGFAMPHSPRLHGGRLWVLDSGRGHLDLVDPHSGQRDVVTAVPGYTRGLAFRGPYAFVGLSRIRETAIFGGVPIAEFRDQLKCGVAVVDLRNRKCVAYLEFETGVEEVFDVQVLPDVVSLAITGPIVDQETPDVWVVPREDQVEALVSARQSPTRKAGT